MDADDISLPDRLAQLADAARENPEVVLWGGYAVRSSKGKRMRRIHSGPESAEEYLEYRRAHLKPSPSMLSNTLRIEEPSPISLYLKHHQSLPPNHIDLHTLTVS